MERPEPRVRLCQIERGGGKLVAEGDVRAVAPLMKVLDWLDREAAVLDRFRAMRSAEVCAAIVRSPTAAAMVRSSTSWTKASLPGSTG